MGRKLGYRLCDDATSALQALQKQAELVEQRSDYCFPTARGTPMTRQGLCQRIRKFGVAVGAHRNVTPMALRRSVPRRAP
ncbi:MAG: hypothetical protein ABI661_00980 [Gammaproteobacteria bacterium]